MKGLRRQEQFQGFWCKSTLLMLANGRKESLAENFNIKKAGNRWGKMWKYRNRKHFYFKLLFNDQKSFWGAFSDVIWKNPFSISVRVISASLLQSWGKMGCKQTWRLLFFTDQVCKHLSQKCPFLRLSPPPKKHREITLAALLPNMRYDCNRLEMVIK